MSFRKLYNRSNESFQSNPLAIILSNMFTIVPLESSQTTYLAE